MAGSQDALTSGDELDDGERAESFRLAHVDLSLLTSSIVLGALGGIVVGMALLVWPERTDQIVVRIVGCGLVWLAITGLRSLPQKRGSRLRSSLGPLVALAIGVVLLLNPDRSTEFVGRSVAVLLLLYVAREIIEDRRERRAGREAPPIRWPFLAATSAIAVMLLLLTGEVFAALLAVSAMLLVALCLLVLVVSLDGRTEGVASYEGTSQLVVAWLRDRPKSLEARQSLYDKILYEGPTTRTRVIRFFALMGFASVIASMGVITDSTAVVIGAMLVAPLMTPLMGMAISLVMGWPNRLLRASSLAFAGIAFAIAIGALLGLIAPTEIDTLTNSQILGRSTPTTLDLITAIAAGGAGAYGLSRPDVSDSLPGVAIAISLVPPLTVVGIALSQGDVTSGGGALLLFATNMVAILIVGGLTFVLTGVTPVDRAASSRDRVRTAMGVTVTAAVLVVGALLLNGAQIASDALNQNTVAEAINAWLPEESGHRLVQSTIEGDVVSAVVIGPSDGLGDPAQLAAELADELDRDITVRVSLVVEERFEATSS